MNIKSIGMEIHRIEKRKNLADLFPSSWMFLPRICCTLARNMDLLGGLSLPLNTVARIRQDIILSGTCTVR